MRVFSTKKIKQCLISGLRTILPMECPICGGIPFDDAPGMLCTDCLRRLPLISGETCPGCGGPMNGILEVCPDCLKETRRPWKQAVALFRMEGMGRELVSMLKYRKHPELARTLGDLLAFRVSSEIPEKIDMVVPTPLHWTRQLQRGYNQSELVAERLAAGLNVPLCNVLCRRKRTRQQAMLSREERLKNLNGAFCIKNSQKVEKRAILLTDDVLTTGSTLTAETEELMEAGASAVYVAVLARR